MNLARYLLAVAMILTLMALPAAAEWANEEWNEDDLSGWQALTIENVVEVLPAGGVGDSGYLHTYQTAPTFGMAGAIQRFEPYIGDFGARDYMVVRCALKFISGTFESAVFRVRYLDAGHNGWYLPLTTDFSLGEWRNSTNEFDPDWTDGEAEAAGWIQESASASFQETMANVYTVEIRIQGGGNLEVGIDNFQLDDDMVATEAVSWTEVKSLFR